jgi:hypothetical protein
MGRPPENEERSIAVLTLRRTCSHSGATRAGCVGDTHARCISTITPPDIESVTKLLTVGSDEKSPAARLRKVEWTATTSRGLHLDEAASFYLACTLTSNPLLLLIDVAQVVSIRACQKEC